MVSIIWRQYMEMLKMIEDSIRKIVGERIELHSRLGKKNIQPAGFFYSEDDFQISLIHEFEFQDNYKKDFIVYYEKSYSRNRIDIVLEKDSTLYPIELKYAYDSYGTCDKYFFTIAAGFKEDILKMTNVFDQEKNMKCGYCIALVDEQKYIKNMLEILKIEINDNDLPDKGPIYILGENKDVYNYKFVCKPIEKTPFHYLIVEVSRKGK